ncbi:hypothetical protein QBC41DRAFT_306175 [Cercophora samala]|uniref:Uncharacterized protein n=1 Tax=Cercophora samala TaxID=330535 RepID=A0AA40D8A7_9PEZI|nr:hypothetical protein QBC41DRAFT_306175 [Cercophora samala]
MQLTTLTAILAGLITTVTADGMSVYSKCPPGSGINCPERVGLWYTDYGLHKIDARGGCLYNDATGVPGIYELCIDWANGRGHFLASGQPKRCIKQRGARELGGGHCTAAMKPCFLDSFHEVGCTW